jgi:hypothetical protein
MILLETCSGSCAGAKAPYARTTSVQAPIQSSDVSGKEAFGRNQQGSAFKSNAAYIQHFPANARTGAKHLPTPDDPA